MTQTAFVYTEAKRGTGCMVLSGRTITLRPVTEREVAKVPMEHLEAELREARKRVPIGTYFTHNPSLDAYRVIGHHIDCKTNKVFLQYVPMGPTGVPHPDEPQKQYDVVMGRPFADFVEDRFIRMAEPDGQLFSPLPTPEDEIQLLREALRGILAHRTDGSIETMYRDDVDYRTVLSKDEVSAVLRALVRP